MMLSPSTPIYLRLKYRNNVYDFSLTADLFHYETILSRIQTYLSKLNIICFQYEDDDRDLVSVKSELEIEPIKEFYFNYLKQCHLNQYEYIEPLLIHPVEGPRHHLQLTLPNDNLSVLSDISQIRSPIFEINSRNKLHRNLEENVFNILSSGQMSMLTVEYFEQIGNGNSGLVHRCRERNTKRIVAVKIISLDYQKDEKKQEIISELNALYALHSSYVVQLYGAYFHENSIHICTEYMNRGSLEQYLGLNIPENVLGRITLSILKGLVYMWQKKIMHRDLKPSNVLADSSGNIKLCDFGVSRI
ncbi:unnamed protein product, partial [Didymodactylos carnosus]